MPRCFDNRLFEKGTAFLHFLKMYSTYILYFRDRNLFPLDRRRRAIDTIAETIETAIGVSQLGQTARQKVRICASFPGGTGCIEIGRKGMLQSFHSSMTVDASACGILWKSYCKSLQYARTYCICSLHIYLWQCSISIYISVCWIVNLHAYWN